MGDLAAFLLARIAEDEEDARPCRGPEWTVLDHTEPKWGADDGDVELLGGGKPLAKFTDYGRNVEPYHITRWDPARVLAECQAKRQIINSLTDGRRPHQAPSPWPDADVIAWTCQACGRGCSDGRDDGDCPIDWRPAPKVLHLLALPFADHSDYRAEWRP